MDFHILLQILWSGWSGLGWGGGGGVWQCLIINFSAFQNFIPEFESKWENLAWNLFENISQEIASEMPILHSLGKYF